MQPGLSFAEILLQPLDIQEVVIGWEWLEQNRGLDKARGWPELSFKSDLVRKRFYMTQGEISEALRGFLMVYVHSFEDLETLLLARRTRNTPVSPEQVANTLNLDPTLASEALTQLAAVGLLRIESHTPLTYQYGPPPDLAEFVDELAKAYEEQRLSVITAVGSNAIVRVKTSAIKTFAEAFMVRKGPKK
jgi:hypothetical protein